MATPLALQQFDLLSRKPSPTADYSFRNRGHDINCDGWYRSCEADLTGVILKTASFLRVAGHPARVAITCPGGRLGLEA
jgi:hypothetical protein